MRTRHLKAGPAVLAAGLLAVMAMGACAGGPGQPPATTGPPPDAATSSPPGYPMPTLPPTRLPSPPVAADSTLTGEVESGVEAGCVLLRTEHGDYLLLGEAVADLRIGSTITVRGQVRRDMSTICQQGTPFEVTEVLD